MFPLQKIFGQESSNLREIAWSTVNKFHIAESTSNEYQLITLTAIDNNTHQEGL
jgi:hypothetical protein